MDTQNYIPIKVKIQRKKMKFNYVVNILERTNDVKHPAGTSKDSVKMEESKDSDFSFIMEVYEKFFKKIF